MYFLFEITDRYVQTGHQAHLQQYALWRERIVEVFAIIEEFNSSRHGLEGVVEQVEGFFDDPVLFGKETVWSDVQTIAILPHGARQSAYGWAGFDYVDVNTLLCQTPSSSEAGYSAADNNHTFSQNDPPDIFLQPILSLVSAAPQYCSFIVASMLLKICSPLFLRRSVYAFIISDHQKLFTRGPRRNLC